MTYNFRTLNADEIECRVGQISEDYFTLLLYKDARCDMNILDETVGCGNWQRDHKEIKGNLYGGVAIYDDNKKAWVTKWDCGTESNTEKEKGEASDSFKRACVNWGIGRELYTAPFIKINGNVKKTPKGKLIPAFWNIQVVEIGYNEKREICKLVITGDGQEIYSFSNGGQNPATQRRQPAQQSTETQAQPQRAQGQQSNGSTMTEEQALNFSMKKGKHAGKPFKDVPQDYLKWLVENLDGGVAKTAAELVLKSIANVQQGNPTQADIYDDPDIPF